MILEQATDEDKDTEECSQCTEEPEVYIDGQNGREFLCLSCINELGKEIDALRKASS